MERIVYNKTLDTHKSGVQFTLQGFETADKASRRIVISLMASGDAIDLPHEMIDAVMYVTTPGIEETSINACRIEGNTIIYDVLPITKEGITTMQLKLIGAKPDGVTYVLASPRFAVEVVESGAEDESIENTATYTAVEEAIARARGAYDSRLLRIALNTDCMFYAYYADGTIYESDVLKELFNKGEALLAQSYARGDTGIRDGEDTDNSMYYSNVSKSEALNAKAIMEDSEEILEEVKLHGVYTAFKIDFEKGEVEYVSPSFEFNVNPETGELDAIGQTYTFNSEIERVLLQWLEDKGYGNGFLSVDGGTLTGKLIMKKGSGNVTIELVQDTVPTKGMLEFQPIIDRGAALALRNYASINEQTNLQLNPSNYELKKLLRLTVNDIDYYNIFGEHNATEYGIARIVTGSYDGAGTYGQENPNILTFNGKPMMVIVNGVVFYRGNSSVKYIEAATDMLSAWNVELRYNFGDDNISWYLSGPSNIEFTAKKQLNSAVTYNYIAVII